MTETKNITSLFRFLFYPLAKVGQSVNEINNIVEKKWAEKVISEVGNFPSYSSQSLLLWWVNCDEFTRLSDAGMGNDKNAFT